MDKYIQRRKELDKYFENSGEEKDFSEFEGFRLSISSCETKKGCWNYSRGIVYRISDNYIIADVKRNYSSFWHSWVNHPNGKKYMLCGEDYQGYSIVNLTDNTYQVHFPEEGYQGSGFCWVSATPSPSGKLLAVEGCYWACPFDIRIYDFSQPDILPYKILGCIDAMSGFKGWDGEDKINIINEVDFRKSDGKVYNEMTKEEIEKAIDDEDIDSKEEIISKVWKEE